MKFEFKEIDSNQALKLLSLSLLGAVFFVVLHNMLYAVFNVEEAVSFFLGLGFIALVFFWLAYLVFLGVKALGRIVRKKLKAG